MFSFTKHLTCNHLIATLTLIPQVLSEPNYKKHHLMLSKPIKQKHLPSHKIILFYPSKKKPNIFSKLAQVALPEIFFPLQKQDQKFNQRAEHSQSACRVRGNNSISLSSHWSSVSHRKGFNWLLPCRGFIASMATLLPYCLGKVKTGERGEATFTQTLPLHYSSFVPECL